MTEGLPTRVPPHSVDAEMALLSAMLQDPAMAVNEVASSVSAQFFFIEKHRKIFDAVLALYEETGGAIDLVGMSEILARRGDLEFIGGSSYLAELFSSTSLTISLEHYIGRLREYYFLRKLIVTCSSIAERGYQIEENISDFIGEAERTFLEISQEQNKRGFASIGTILKPALSKLQQLVEAKQEITGVPCGIVDFDKITAGFQPSDLIILGARPAMGKTALALNMMMHAALKADKVCAFFSLEMASEQLVMRVLASEARINSSNFRRGFMVESDWARLSNATEKIFQTNVFIDDTADITVTEIRSKCRQLKAEKERLDFVLIDYLQLIRGGTTHSGDSREREIAEISRNLKAMAKELQVPVLALCQLNRGLESRPDKRPKTSDLRESGSIEQDADLIFFLYRDEVYHANSEKEGIAELIIGKNRHGSISTVEAAFLKDYVLFQNLQKDEYH